jgi:hypothetical protein
MKSVEVVEANFLSQLSAAAAEMVMYTGKDSWESRDTVGRKSLVARCHSFDLFLHLSSSHTILIYTTYTTRREPLLLSSLHPLRTGPPLGCRAEILTRACRTASRCATI